MLHFIVFDISTFNIKSLISVIEEKDSIYRERKEGVERGRLPNSKVC